MQKLFHFRKGDEFITCQYMVVYDKDQIAQTFQERGQERGQVHFSVKNGVRFTSPPDEPMGVWQIAGTVLVLIGVFTVTRPAK